MLSFIIYTIGFVTTLRLLYWLYEIVEANYLQRPLDVREMGQWALVTGATDGIGKAYTEALAKKGLNIVLVSRTMAKLDQVAAEIKEKYNVQTKVISVDFCGDAKEYVKKIESEIKGLEIGVLVNNVGMSYDYPEEFLSIKDGESVIERIVACNIVSVNSMVRLILPQMVERQRGAVINISSFTGLYTFPLLSAYAASKAYVANFTKGLRLEYAQKGVVIQGIMPGYVCSKMSKVRRPTLMIPTPETFVASALKRLGTHGCSTGYWPHELHLFVLDLLPERFGSKMVHDELKVIRAKALKKLAS